MKNLLAGLIASIIKFFYLLYYNTMSIRVIDTPWAPHRLADGKNCIYVFWHSKSFLILPYCRNSRIGTLTLMDWKNLIFDRLCKKMRYHTVPVASSSLAVLELRNLLEQGFSIGLALDGPHGPAGVIKPGALHLSRTTQKPIVVVNLRADRSYRIRQRWDRYEIPLPFTKVVAKLSEPFYANDSNLEKLEQEIRSFSVDH